MTTKMTNKGPRDCYLLNIEAVGLIVLEKIYLSFSLL